MSKWAIELSEHEITYGSRHAIKGQIMADLVEVDTPPLEIPGNKSKAQPTPASHEDETWTLYTNVRHVSRV
jgi:hypothetical protein